LNSFLISGVSALTTAAALTRENAESTKAEATMFWNDFIMDVSGRLQKGRKGAE
jgi:hypothetical protein